MDEQRSDEQRSFINRMKQGSHANPNSVKVVEEENDFPFRFIDFVRIGSAHAQCESTHDEANADLLRRLSAHLLARYEPELLPAIVEIELK